MTGSYQELIASETPVLIDFFAIWCGPCQTMNPILQKLADEYGDNLRIVKMDVDKNAKLAADVGVRGVPTIMLYKKGKLLWSEPGVQSLQKIKGKLKENGLFI